MLVRMRARLMSRISGKASAPDTPEEQNTVMAASDGLPETYGVVGNALHAIGPQADIAQIGVFETQRGVRRYLSPSTTQSKQRVLTGAVVISGEVFRLRVSNPP